MIAWIAQLLAGPVIDKFTGPLLRAYEAKLAAQNDTERLEKLFDLYTKITAGQAKPKKGKAK